MSRYIDADAMIKSIESDRNCSDMPSQWIDGVNYAIDLIELYESTIDIVRCSECKWYNCGACFRDDGVNNSRNADDFCSYGSRSEKPNNCEDEPQTCSFSDCDNFKNPDYERCIECKRKQIKLKTERKERSSE